VVGAISPIGQKRSHPTVLDREATAWPTVFCSAGRRGLELELAPTDLLALTGGRVAAVARHR
jgi:Cys-tRNA(Pro)/Cys-tRNA(Cys) deacylase